MVDIGPLVEEVGGQAHKATVSGDMERGEALRSLFGGSDVVEDLRVE